MVLSMSSLLMGRNMRYFFIFGLLERRLPAITPRKDAVACFRLAMGHDYLQTRLK